MGLAEIREERQAAVLEAAAEAEATVRTLAKMMKEKKVRVCVCVCVFVFVNIDVHVSEGRVEVRFLPPSLPPSTRLRPPSSASLKCPCTRSSK